MIGFYEAGILFGGNSGKVTSFFWDSNDNTVHKILLAAKNEVTSNDDKWPTIFLGYPAFPV